MKTNIKENILLEILEDSNGSLNWPDIVKRIRQAVYESRSTQPTEEYIAHKYYLLEKEGAVEKIEKGHNGQVWYKLTPWGHAKLDCPISKFWFYILHKKDHNLLAILSFVIAIIALVKSFWK